MYRFDVTSSVGTNYEKRWAYTPASAATVTWSVDIYNFDNVKVASGSTILKISDGTAVPSAKNILIVGDSKTAAQTWVDELASLSGANLSFVGTQGTTNLHEGWSGKTYNWFANNAASPFVNSGKLDVRNYLTTNSLSDPDFVVFELGTNDVFQQISTSSVLTDIDSLIAAFRKDLPNVGIGLAIEIPPSKSQDAFGNNYDNGNTQWQFRQDLYSFNKAIYDAYKVGGGKYQSYVTLIPFYVNIDTEHNMNTTTTAYNARNSATYEMQSNGVHPAASGYYQMADACFGWLKGRNVGMASYLVDEDFEGTGTPTGWTGTATINYDYTPAIHGTESAKITDTGTTYVTTPDFAAQSDVWVFGAFNYSAVTADAIILYLRNATSGNAGYLSIRQSDMKIRFYHGTTSPSVGTTTISTGTTYYYWIHYIKGTGSDGVSQIYLSTTTTRPSSPELSATNGSGTYDVEHIRYYDWTATSDYIFDVVRVSATEIVNY